MEKKVVPSCVVKESLDNKKRMITVSGYNVISSNNIIKDIIEKMKQIDMQLNL